MLENLRDEMMTLAFQSVRNASTGNAQRRVFGTMHRIVGPIMSYRTEIVRSSDPVRAIGNRYTEASSYPLNMIQKLWSSSTTENFSSSRHDASKETAESKLGITNVERIRSKIGGTATTLPLSKTLRRKRTPVARKRSSSRFTGVMHPVTAIHLGQSIDISSVINQVFPVTLKPDNGVALTDTKSLVVELPVVESSDPNAAPSRYMAVYGFGSVVGLNVPKAEFQLYLDKIRYHVLDPVQVGSERKEDFGVVLHPTNLYPEDVAGSEEASAPIITGDYCVMSTLDLDGVAVISNIMAQTVALDTYNDTANDFLNRFAAINSSVRATGKFKSSDKSFLVKSVAHNNAIFIDMISKIRLKDRSDTAWKISRYEDIHYGLKAEFEIDDRFDQIEYKLNLIQQNSKFFLQVLASEKSNSLEWTIVILIVAECILMCVEMSGMGTQIMSYLGSFIPSFSPPAP